MLEVQNICFILKPVFILKEVIISNHRKIRKLEIVHQRGEVGETFMVWDEGICELAEPVEGDLKKQGKNFFTSCIPVRLNSG